MQAHGMTPLQMMRAVLNALQQPSLFSKGIAMQQRPSEAGGAGGSPPGMAVFRRHHAAVFVDPSGHLNLAAQLSKSAMAEVRFMSMGNACRPPSGSYARLHAGSWLQLQLWRWWRPVS